MRKSFPNLLVRSLDIKKGEGECNIEYSNVVPHRSTNPTRRCLTSLSRREAVLSSWYGRIRQIF
eukprot:scaffold2655_cov179-Amphora_coffeaeformis.AAC.33